MAVSAGVFVHENTELKSPDVIPIELTRTYRTGDTIVRPFGIGATHNYAMYLRTPTAGNCSVVELVLPDGALIDFQPVSPTQSPGNVTVYQHTGTPSRYLGATVVGWTFTPAGSSLSVSEVWILTLADGTIYNVRQQRPGRTLADRR